MSWLNLLPWRRNEAQAMAPGAVVPVNTPQRQAASQTSLRPTYSQWGSGYSNWLRREFNPVTFQSYYGNLPVIKRTVEILAGLVGTPELKTADDGATADLQAWAQNVPAGYIGHGLGIWLRDHLSQALNYGYGIGEAEIDEARSEIVRLWSYRSTHFYFEVTPAGAVTVKQRATDGDLTLDATTGLVTTHGSQGMSPQGESFWLAIPTVSQMLLDQLHARRETVRRNGIPTYHVHTRLPESMAVNDPDGVIADQINQQVAGQWNTGILKQVTDGQAQDFFTCNVGETAVKIIGENSGVIDFPADNKTLMEHVISATGIPPFMFGLSWSASERMSKQQADMLLALVDALRSEVSPAVRHVLELRQRLAVQRPGLKVELDWPDVNLQDLEATARAAMMDASADLAREKLWATGWRNGVVDQDRYAQEVFGVEEVDEARDAPAAAPASGNPPLNPGGGDGSPAILTTAMLEALAT